MKERILEKSCELFLNLGFKSVTMDDIASQMGISKKTLYKYFSNKASLVDASTDMINDDIGEKISAVKSQNYNAIEEEFVIKTIFKEMFKNSEDSQVYQLKKYYPEIYDKMMNAEEGIFRDCNRDNLEKGIAQGLYRTDLEIDLIMNFYFSLIFSMFDKNIVNISMKELMQMEYKILEYHIRAIATEKGLIELEKQLYITKQNN